MRHFTTQLLALAIAATALTSSAADKKKRTRHKPVLSPIIHDDNSVTFRIKAPGA